MLTVDDDLKKLRITDLEWELLSHFQIILEVCRLAECRGVSHSSLFLDPSQGANGHVEGDLPCLGWFRSCLRDVHDQLGAACRQEPPAAKMD